MVVYTVTNRVIESRRNTAKLYNTKKVQMYDLTTNELIDTYESIGEAEFDNDLPIGSIYKALCRSGGVLKKSGLMFVRV